MRRHGKSLRADAIPKSATPSVRFASKFDGAYWRKLDRERGYPTEFVKALTEAGWLST